MGLGVVFHEENAFERIGDGQIFDFFHIFIFLEHMRLLFETFDLVQVCRLTLLQAVEPTAVVIKLLAWVVLDYFDLGIWVIDQRF